MKPRVTFMCWDASVASARMRAIIPQRELMLLGIEPGRDVLVIGKHDWDWDKETRGYKKVVYDVCDDHFDDELAPHYLDACARADAVTCNSAAMAARIKAKTGRDAWIIPDPYEAPEGRARVGDSLLWYGHSTNLRDLVPWLDSLIGRKLTVVSNVEPGDSEGVRRVVWSPAAMNAEFERAGLVIIPTGNRVCKSNNRAVEAIRRGLYPICGPLPAYADLGVWIGQIDEGVDWALSNRDEVVRRIEAAQNYVRWTYNPARICKLWLEALSFV